MAWERIRRRGRTPIPSTREDEQGQVILLFSLVLVALLGVSAFVVDIARVYALQRYERSTADAAALAGAQDLQIPGGRSVSNDDYIQARIDALALLTHELGAPGSAVPTGTGTTPSGSSYNCDPGTPGSGTSGSNIIDCPIPGSPFLVSVKTPSPSVMTVDAAHAVQVTVRQPSVSMTFSRLLGQTGWNVGQTSVAGLTFSPQYAVVSLQPPYVKHNGTDANLCKDLVVDGNNTVLLVDSGDIGTNTSAATTNQGTITLDAGYFIDYVDGQTSASCGTNVDPTWAVDANGQPQGQQLQKFITDPGYPYAQFPTSGPTPAPTFTGNADPAAQTACSSSTDFPTDSSTVSDYLTPAPGGTLTCYKPGIYAGAFTVSNGDVAYLLPGAYSFQAGVTVDGTLAGGLLDKGTGVVLVLPESGSSQQFLANNSNASIVLNTGSADCSSDACRATPATDFAGAAMETPAGQTITVEVERDDNCFSPYPDGVTPDYSTCSGDLNLNKTLKLTSAYLVRIAGVIYGPSDNMQITGGSSQQGLIGQVWSWTVTYTGGSTLNEESMASAQGGEVRLDTACSGAVGFGLGSGIVCNP